MKNSDKGKRWKLGKSFHLLPPNQKKWRRVRRFLIALLAVSFFLPILAGCTCQDEEPWRKHYDAMGEFKTVPRATEGEQVETSPIEQVWIHTKRGVRASGHGAGWTLIMGFIVGWGWVVIFAVPGFIFGRAEKPGEAFLWGIPTGFLASYAFERGLNDAGLLGVEAVLCAVFLLIWGARSGDEKYKLALPAIPTLTGVGYVLFSGYIGLLEGLFATLIVPILFFLIVKLVFIAIFRALAK